MNFTPRLAEIDWPDTPFPLQPAIQLVARRGSESHGTYVPPTDPNGIDDRDVMAAVIPPERYLLGLSEWDHAEAIKGVWDVVLYDFRKFVRLLIKQNPNVVSMLWLRAEDYLYIGPAGATLIRNRHLFRQRKAALDAFAGYAHGQLKRMTHMEPQGYMGAKRKKLVEKYGYDVKNAAHLVRLLHTGIEYLRDGELRPFRTWDRDMLVTIKTGGWSLERVHAYAEDQFAAINAAYEASTLPTEIDREAIERLVIAEVRRSLTAAPSLSPTSPSPESQ